VRDGVYGDVNHERELRGKIKKRKQMTKIKEE
jgi:hypothetical protein